MGTNRGRTALDAAHVARAHVDKHEHGSLLSDLIASTVRETLNVSVADEATDTIAVTLTLQEGDASTAKARAATVHCHLLDAAMLDSLTDDFRMSETGAGTGVSTAAKPGLQVTLSAAGTAVVTITDVSGASGATLYLECTTFGAVCAPTLTAIAFD